MALKNLTICKFAATHQSTHKNSRSIFTANRKLIKTNLFTSTAAALLLGFVGSTYAAGYTVQQLNLPGAATRMSDNGSIVGNYVSKCTTFTYGAHEKGTYCYWAPWFYDGKSVTKLGNLWSGTRSTAADINDSLQLTGSDGSDAWTYFAGTLTRMAGGTPVAINNTGVAAGNAPMPVLFTGSFGSRMAAAPK